MTLANDPAMPVPGCGCKVAAELRAALAASELAGQATLDLLNSHTERLKASEARVRELLAFIEFVRDATKDGSANYSGIALTALASDVLTKGTPP